MLPQCIISIFGLMGHLGLVEIHVRLKNFKMTVTATILDIKTEQTLNPHHGWIILKLDDQLPCLISKLNDLPKAILNLHCVSMPLIKFGDNPTYVLGEDAGGQSLIL